MIIGTAMKAGVVGLVAGGLLLAPMAAPKPLSRLMSVEAKADSIGNFFKKMNKPRKRGRNNNPDLGIKVLQGVGVGLAVVGLAKGNTGAIIVGTALAAAPIVFRKELHQKYGRDQNWAGCLNCRQKRVLVQPGRDVSKAEQQDILNRVKADVMDVQRALKTLGYYKKGIDGDYGPGSRRAAIAFQKSLNAPPTGQLSAHQRAELFRQARAAGFEPQSAIGATALMGVEPAPLSPSPATPTRSGAPVPISTSPGQSTPSIREFRLATSQVEKFTEEVLRKGDLSEVETATLLPDGLLEIRLRDSAAHAPLRGGVETITIAPHDLSDDWVRISMPEGSGKDPVVLNTIDSFSSKKEADAWSAEANQQIKILAKLTERDTQPAAPTVVARAHTPAATPAAAAPANEPATSGSDNPFSPSEPGPENAVRPAAVSQPQPAAGDEPVPAAASPDEPVRMPEQCGESLYVSFNFPEKYEKINHFNIMTPESAIMTDNGDGTGYLTGSCVQGEYSYKYVIVNQDKKNKSWSFSEQEGSFVIASLAGQCEIDLNDPTKSATLHCY